MGRVVDLRLGHGLGKTSLALPVTLVINSADETCAGCSGRRELAASWDDVNQRWFSTPISATTYRMSAFPLGPLSALTNTRDDQEAAIAIYDRLSTLSRFRTDLPNPVHLHFR